MLDSHASWSPDGVGAAIVVMVRRRERSMLTSFEDRLVVCGIRR
jgi:hypothetical protein